MRSLTELVLDTKELLDKEIGFITFQIILIFQQLPVNFISKSSLHSQNLIGNLNGNVCWKVLTGLSFYYAPDTSLSSPCWF
jgi:hypothetical protein